MVVDAQQEAHMPEQPGDGARRDFNASLQRFQPGNYFHGTTVCLSGLHEKVYRRYALDASQDNSYLARYLDVVKRYPMMAPADMLADPIKTTPGEVGKWFATAKLLELFNLALEFAKLSPFDPTTLTRAARDYLNSEPEFAQG